ncbi:MAG: 2-isopropylmalate synthase [Candidatus Ancillula trichonymphae]|jgi:2-isopropylmalate synthase|nr:2-isopropylmalate synthase [Candidatus Ancillula trichonymphae]
MPWERYVPYSEQIVVDGSARTWPDKTLVVPPRWCSVDLRDGNQALIEPMDNKRKLKFWNLLLQLGFKEVEVGFPAASETDFNFIRMLIERDLIPEDVTIGVLTQAREELIKRTYESLVDARRAYVHLYNSTSKLQRKVVFKMSEGEILQLAENGAKLCRKYEKLLSGTDLYYEYTPESFTGTELEFAARCSNAVAEIFEAGGAKKVMINLPSTVEMTTPNVYADTIEWMCKHIGRPTDSAPDDEKVADRDKCSFTRDDIVVSLHPHNDQGMGIAAAHLGLLAGADRVEGCLFGNGERTGNVDLVAMALNLFSVGVDPELEIKNIREIRRTVEYCNGLGVHERHPYAGDLVFTAFSGSHQDAIKKGIEALEKQAAEENAEVETLTWAVPYLPIDPRDIGASYESIIRVNSQSGKGGVAYILRNRHNLNLPRRLQIEFSKIVQKYTETSGQEASDTMIYKLFCDEYLPVEELDDKAGLSSWGRIKMLSIEHTTKTDCADSVLKVRAIIDKKEHELVGIGNGPIDAFISIVSDYMPSSQQVQILDYSQHAMTSGQNASAATYVECRIGDETFWGVGVDSSTTKAALKAVASAVNRATRKIDSKAQGEL